MTWLTTTSCLLFVGSCCCWHNPANAFSIKAAASTSLRRSSTMSSGASLVLPALLDDSQSGELNLPTFASQQPVQLNFTSPLDILPPIVDSTKSLCETLGVDDRTVAYDYSSSRPRVCGHRGALYDELENTRGSFLQCAKWGCDSVELDVFRLKCGTVIVFHGGGTDQNPGDLSDYCLGRKGVSILDLTYQQALELEFNPSFEEFPCPIAKIQQAKIPTLEQVLLDAKATGIRLRIELKGPGTVEPVLELVEKHQMVDQCQYASFDLERLWQLRQLRPQTDECGNFVYATGALFDASLPDDFLSRARSVQASEIHLRYDTCSVDRIDAIHKAGFGSMAWFRGPIGMTNDVLERFWDVGNEDESMYAAVVATGVQELCVNKPNVLLRLLK